VYRYWFGIGDVDGRRSGSGQWRPVGVGVLGPVVVEGDGALSPRERVILSALALQQGQVVRPDQLADAVWGEHPPSTWPKQVQASVGLVRKALGSAAIETTAAGYRLALDADEVDVRRFEALVARARTLAATGEPDRAAATFARALSLWRGPPFGELHRWPPAESEAARLEELRRSAEEELLDARLACGEHREVAADAEAAVNVEPLRERRWAVLALAQYRCGRQGDALRTLHRARRTLVEQLGIDPGRELATLEAAILNQDEGLDARIEPAPVSEACPYKGLAAYDVDDYESFFGRDTQIAACLERLHTTPFLVVTGASGCGKSSLVRAGLAPVLSRPDRPVVVVPGPDPLAALVDGSASAGKHGTLIVDQFEELFAVGVPQEVPRSFCAALAERVASGSALIVAIRADHLTGLAADPDLGKLAERGLHFVTPLAGDELRAAIEQPAHQAGLRVERGLVDLLVRDVEGEPGALPLLSHARVETWRRRDGHVLTVEGYRASGGVRGAVARSADRLYDGLPVEQRPLLRSLMLRLVAPSLEGDPVRCRVAASALRDDPARERVVALLVRARLVTTEEDTIELAHEALARAWPRLRSWLDDDSAGQRIMRHLAAAADGWESLGRPDSELYRGARLDTALEYRQNARPDLTATEAEFLEASQQQAETERDAFAARARLDARRNRRLRALLIAIGGLLAVSLVAGLLALRSSHNARDQRDLAQAATDDAQLEALVNRSLALRSTDRDVAALLAIEAARRWPDDPRATSALLGTFTAAHGFLGHRYLADAEWLDGALVPGTSTAVIAPDGGRLAVLNVDTGEIAARFLPPDDYSTGLEIRVSTDGRSVVQLRGASGDECFDLASLERTDANGCASFSVYEVASGRRILGPITPPVGPGGVATNADGSLVAVVGGYDGDLVLYRTADGSELGRVPGPARPESAQQRVDTAAVTFGPDGLIYVGSMAGPIRVVDPTDLGVMKTIDAAPFASNRHVSVGSDGVLVAAGDEALVAADVSTGAIRWTMDIRGTHPEPCPYFAASVAAGRLYCGNYFGVIEERDRATGQRTGVTLDPQLGSVGALGITENGDELVAFGAQNPAVSRWRLDGGGLVTSKVAKGHVAADGYDFVNGSTLVVAKRSPGATIDIDFDDFALWDTETDREVAPLELGIGVGWTGRDTLTGITPDLETRWYDVSTRSVVHGVDFPIGGPDECSHTWATAGGDRAYCGLNNGDVWTIDVPTRQRIEPTLHVDGFPQSVSATRGGATVVITTHAPDIGAAAFIFDGNTGEQIGEPLLGPNLAGISLDGNMLVGATGGNITRYDPTTRQPLADLPGARGEINTLQFSDDGKTLLATSLDQTVSIYDVASVTRLGDPIPMDAPFIYGAFLRPDGKAAAVTDRTGIQIWDLDPKRLRDAACELAGRNLTTTEWDTYLGHLGDHRPTCPGFA
jgi:DNA-binding SARP family transcriptional activator/WD40 repeat protein